MLIQGMLSLENVNLDLNCLVSENFTNILEKNESLKLAVEDGSLGTAEETSAKYSLSEYFSLPSRHRSLLDSVDIFHSPHYTLPFNLNCKSVVTIHDVIHITHPEKFWHKFVGKILIRSAAKRANKIIAVSEAAKKQIELYTGVPDGKVAVIKNSLRPSLKDPSHEQLEVVRRKHSLLKDYYLFVGSDRPHKGFPELVQAWQSFDFSRPSKVPTLVLVGERFGPESRLLAAKAGVSSKFKFLGGVDEVELAALYSGAKGVLLPSREEGFGLAALEAMALGSAVICSPVESIQEVCGKAAAVAEDFSSESFFRALSRVENDQEFREQLISLGRRRSASYSFQEMAKETLDCYADTIENSPGKVKAEPPAESIPRKAVLKKAGQG